MITRIPNSLLLPTASERWTPLWVQYTRIEVEDSSIMLVGTENSVISLPSAQITSVILGPGTAITHAAINRLAECHTPIIWTGADGFIFYAAGKAWTHTNSRAKKQIELWANKRKRREIAQRMFLDRFNRKPRGETLQEFRLDEGLQMKKLYEETAKKHEVPWNGRITKLKGADQINRTITKVYQAIYAMALSAILTTGRIPEIGFIHEASDLPFVYDIADKYKQNIGVEIAFEANKSGKSGEEEAIKRLAQENKNLGIMKGMVTDMERYLI